MKEILASPGETARILDKYGLRAKKKYGQNFLINEGVVRKIIEASGITKEDSVLEIGPGIGTMTQLLARSAGHVTAVEIDRGLEPVLAETLADEENVSILYQDILKTDLRSIADETNGGRPMKCVANLPYYITTPIILSLLEERDSISDITIMIQSEVADRILAKEGSREYGALSLAVAYYAEPEVILQVPPSSFIPRPAVNSTVLCLHALKEPRVKTDPELLFAVIRAAFNQRRKTLANALSHGLSLKGRTWSREDVTAVLRSMDLAEDIRGERLSIEEFASLSEGLKTL